MSDSSKKPVSVVFVPGALDAVSTPEDMLGVLETIDAIKRHHEGEDVEDFKSVPLEIAPDDEKCPVCSAKLICEDGWDEYMVCSNQKCETHENVSFISQEFAATLETKSAEAMENLENENS